MKIPVILLVTTGGVIMYIVLKKASLRPHSAYRQPATRQKDYKNDPEKLPLEISQEYFYLSLLANFLDLYELDPHSDISFYQLLSRLRLEGKKLFLKNLHDLIGQQASAAALVAFYQNRKANQLVFEGPVAATEHADAARLVRAGFQNKLKEGGLSETADKNLREAVFGLLNWEYNAGKDLALSDFDVNFEWLEKYIKAGQEESVLEETMNIRDKLKKNYVY